MRPRARWHRGGAPLQRRPVPRPVLRRDARLLPLRSVRGRHRDPDGQRAHHYRAPRRHHRADGPAPAPPRGLGPPRHHGAARGLHLRLREPLRLGAHRRGGSVPWAARLLCCPHRLETLRPAGPRSRRGCVSSRQPRRLGGLPRRRRRRRGCPQPPLAAHEQGLLDRGGSGPRDGRLPVPLVRS